jgi:hypothetical protein
MYLVLLPLSSILQADHSLTVHCNENKQGTTVLIYIVHVVKMISSLAAEYQMKEL